MRQMFSKKQIEEMINEPLTSGQVDIVAKTLKQREANYLFEFEINVADTTNFEKHGTQYCRIEEVNGELHLIICAMFHNKDTEAQHNMALSVQSITDIPEEISSKIFSCGGKKVSETPSANSSENIIRIAPMGLNGTGVAIQPVRIYHDGKNKISIYGPSGQNVAANGYGVITLEVNLSLM